jgi:hypothetical protein
MGKKDGKGGKKGSSKTVKVENGSLFVAGGRIVTGDGTVIENKTVDGMVVYSDGDMQVTRKK